MRLPHCSELFFESPATEWESRINELLEELCGAAHGCGLPAIMAQVRLKGLLEVSAEERLAMYRSALPEQ